MKCAICDEETIGGAPVKWGPEFAHRTCVIAFKAGQQDEREECAKTCEALWQEEATAAANGTQEPKYHDCIECAYAIRERSNAKVSGGGAFPPSA